MTYEEFLKGKIELATESGFEIGKEELNNALLPHQKDAVQWALRGGKRALFESFGLGKTNQEIEFCHQVVKKYGGKALIVLPLGVRQEFTHDAAEILHYPAPRYVRTMEEVNAVDGDEIVVTNYERVRDGDIEPTAFIATSLDEAAVLRSFGSKTYQTFLDKFKGVRFKMVATATPSPNKYKELIHYAGYLEVMDTGQALTRFFQRDSTKANNLTLYPAQEDEFWLWVSSWALFVSKPSDLDESYSDDGYVLPPLEVRWHELPIEYGKDEDRDGQMLLFSDAKAGLKEAAHIKKESIEERCAKAKEIVDASPDDHFVLWHDRNAERDQLKKLMPEVVDIDGEMDYDLREQRVLDFSYGKTRLFATKKALSGSGCNFQRYCHREIFVGIDYEFHDFIQAVHRCYRFLQDEPVIIDIIYMENEREIKETLLRKWKEHNHMVEKMTEIVKAYGLNNKSRFKRLERKMGVETVRVQGNHYTAVNDDCVEETRRMEDNSIDLIHTSIPFGNHYEYSANYNDFGHNQNDDEFFKQMDFLTPELLRILKPGRVAAIHVKDRILFGNTTGTGMPTVEPFHADCISHYIRHGFQYFGMITVVTDVVRENNQTYRLGYTENCKDSSKMGVGCPEYILLFRKLPSDTSTAYADEPVVKNKDEYSLSRWQIDAHAFWRSNGDRPLDPEEMAAMSMSSRMAKYHEYSQTHIYDYGEHVKLSEGLEKHDAISKTFMTLAPASVDGNVWDDVNRMRTLNTTQSRRKQQMHVCIAEGCLVLTREGYKPIEKVQVGDFVLTHEGNWKPVVAKKCTGNKDTVQTKAQGVPQLVTTRDHKIWSKVHNYASAKYNLANVPPDWCEAEKLASYKHAFVNLVLPEIEESCLTAQEWWLVGRYLADGHKGTRGDFFVSIGENKAAEFEQMAGEFCGSYSNRTARQYRLQHLRDEVKDILRKCGRGAENKQVPIEGLCLTKELSEALLSGYLSGDGSVVENLHSASSASRALLLGMAIVLQRARDEIASIHAGRGERDGVIEGRRVHCKQEWTMSWRTPSRCNYSVIDGNRSWKKVREIVETDVKEVWSIEVADDHSFTVENCVVKNCPLQFDIVERIIDRYSNKGDLVLDPFGGLMTVPMMAVKMGRRGYGIELSEDYFKDGVGYLQAAEMEIDAPTLFDFIDGIEEATG